MFLEGQATLTLTDDLTGKVVDQVTAKNIVTSAADEYLKYFLLGEPVVNVSGPASNRNRNVFDFLGGVMLFSEPIPDNATTRRGRGLETMAPYFIAGADRLGSRVPTSKLHNVGNSVSTNYERVGNAIEYNHIWSFANYISGTIKSLALTGSGVNPYENAYECVLTTPSSTYSRDYIFWVEPSSVDGVWYAYIMREQGGQLGQYSYDITVFKRRFYMPSIDTPVITLFDKNIEWIDSEGETIFSERFDTSTAGSLYYAPAYEYTDGSGNIHFCSMFSSLSRGHDLHIVLHNGDVDVSEASFTAPDDYKLNGHVTYDDVDMTYPFDIRYGDEQHSTVYKRLIKADISSDWNTISNPVVIKDALPYDGSGSYQNKARTTGLVRLLDGGLLILRADSNREYNMYMDSNDTISNPPLYFSNNIVSEWDNGQMTMPSLSKVCDYDTLLRTCAGLTTGRLYVCKSYIGTICNLDTPIVKSSNQVLRVNYKLRAV